MKHLYFFVSFFLLTHLAIDMKAQNENTSITERNLLKREKDSRKTKEKPERQLFVRKTTLPIDKSRKTNGNWQNYATSFDESNHLGSSQSSPIIIETAGHLAFLAKQVNAGNNYAGKYIRLNADIDLKDYEWLPIGIFGDDYQDHSKRFCGHFDGNNHKIRGLTIPKGENYQGFFGVCGEGAFIENLSVTDCYVRGKMIVGGLVGELINGTIRNCSVTGTVGGTKECVGGLIGINNGIIIKSSTSVLVYGNSNDTGGLAGANGDRMMGTIDHCYATEKVSGYYNVGGLVGRNNNLIVNSYAIGNVSGEEWVGGLVGWTDHGKINDCHATGNVTGFFDIGGLVGFNGYQQSTVEINNCYARGEVTGFGLRNYCIGGLVGYSGGIINNSYASGDVRGEESIGGLIGEHGGKTYGSHARGKVIGYYDIGGLIGFNGFPGTPTSVENCYATGGVSGYGTFSYAIGGLAGYSGGLIKQCYAEGPVSGEVSIGGLVGEHGGTIMNSFAYGNVVAKGEAGGLIGWNWAKVESCYSAGNVSANYDTGGLIGRNEDSETVIVLCYFDAERTGQSSGIGADNNNQSGNVRPIRSEEFTDNSLPEGFNNDIWESMGNNYFRLKTINDTDKR
ncbi:MAG: hypothetical protein LBQ60_13320 [Bacteroidales bacterium]|jgi:hypothetical protein|nr:hypothetical protein [Bacteroidales bacterium]